MAEQVLMGKMDLSILNLMANITPDEFTDRLGLLMKVKNVGMAGNGEVEMAEQERMLHIISLMAQKELENIKKRQSDGIAAARAKGIHLGRPVKKLPDNFPVLMELWENGKLRTKDFMAQTGFTESTLYRRLRECNAKKLPQ